MKSYVLTIILFLAIWAIGAEVAEKSELPKPDAEGKILIFNGKDLTGWKGDPKVWSVENGEIVGKSEKGLKHNDFLKSTFELSDFRLTVQMKLVPNGANSGIQIRSVPHGEFEMKGVQCDAGKGWWGMLYEESGRGLLYKESGEKHVKVEEWNTYEIVAVGTHVMTAINGNKCADITDDKQAMKGILGLQVHSGGPTEVRFKDMKVELNPKDELVTIKKQ